MPYHQAHTAVDLLGLRGAVVMWILLAIWPWKQAVHHLFTLSAAVIHQFTAEQSFVWV